jgi:hypothetical protein
MKESRPLFWIHVWSVPLLLVTSVTLIHYLGIFGLPVSSILVGSVLLVLTRRAFRKIAGRHLHATPPPVDYVGVLGSGVERLASARADG